MPGLVLETAWTCAENHYYETSVVGSKGAMYTVWWGLLSEGKSAKAGAQHGWQCNCKGYQYRGTCRHVEGVKASGNRCQWNHELEPTAQCAHDANDKPICPECGGSVRAIRVAV